MRLATSATTSRRLACWGTSPASRTCGSTEPAASASSLSGLRDGSGPSCGSTGRRPTGADVTCVGESRLQRGRRRSRRTPGWWRSAGTCTRCSDLGSDCRTTRTSGPSSSRSTSTGSAPDPGGDRLPAAHGPVGCRDWTTVDLLLSAGVDAFFTGCVTTTVDAVFPDRARSTARAARRGRGHRPTRPQRPPGQPPGRADHPPRPRATGHGRPRRVASARPTGCSTDYQRAYHRIVTSRLHSYLPATSLGVPVDFRPKVPGRRPVRRPARHGAGGPTPSRRCATASASCSPTTFGAGPGRCLEATRSTPAGANSPRPGRRGQGPASRRPPRRSGARSSTSPPLVADRPRPAATASARTTRSTRRPSSDMAVSARPEPHRSLPAGDCSSR